MNRVGEKYGKLTIIQYLDTTWCDRYICQCECGNTKVEAIHNLRRSTRTKFSCGKCPKSDEDYKQWFLARVTKTDSCWIWNQSLDRDGYGSVNIDKVRLKAHRAAYLWVILKRENMFAINAIILRVLIPPIYFWERMRKMNWTKI